MNHSTAKNLNDINAKFYSEYAGEFSGTREYPWNGWNRLIQVLERENIGLKSENSRVLDLGCGNGRFRQFLENKLRNSPLDYLGIDNCKELLQVADSNLNALSGVRFFNVDITQNDIDIDLKFSLIVAFGIMHHIPSLSKRKHVIKKLVKLLEKDAVLVVAFWKFMDHDRYAKKLLSIDDYNRKNTSQLDPNDLDDGDVLLKWGRDGEGLRYCHHTSEEEMDELFLDLPLVLVERFMADGKNNDQNQYVVFRSTK